MNFGSIIIEITTAVVYWPFAHISAMPMCFGVSCQSPPLTLYGDRLFHVVRTDSSDRFCTQLQKHFPRVQVVQMLKEIFEQISFSGSLLHRCAVGIRSQRGRAG